MKKNISFVVFTVALVAGLALTGCKGQLVDLEETKSESVQSENKISERIIQLKQAGLLNQIMNSNNERSAEEKSDIVAEMQEFINAPDAYISENSDGSNEDGTALISAILSGNSVEEVYSIMNNVSPEMAEDFLDNVKSSITGMNETLGRSALSDNDIMSLALGYYDLCSVECGQRSIFAANLNQDTINWYYGMCAATIAGLSASKFCGWWQPWVGVAGLVAAGAGTASMVSQLIIWCTCPEFSNWVSSFANSNSQTATAALNSSVGLKLLGISAATAGVVAYCLVVTPEISEAIIGAVKTAWNTIIRVITAPLPKNVTLIINGVKLVPL